MNGFKAYRYYLALKLHFTQDKFNVFENRGNLKLSLDKFLARNDSQLFERLARKFNKDQDYIQYIVANWVYNNPNMIWHELEAQSHYTTWLKIKESITFTFTSDLNTIYNNSENNDIINCTKNGLPIIIKLYLELSIQPQTICILDDLTGCINKWLLDSSIKLLFEDDLRKIKKMRGFFSYDKEKLQKIYTSHDV